MSNAIPVLWSYIGRFLINNSKQDGAMLDAPHLVEDQRLALVLYASKLIIRGGGIADPVTVRSLMRDAGSPAFLSTLIAVAAR